MGEKLNIYIFPDKDMHLTVLECPFKQRIKTPVSTFQTRTKNKQKLLYKLNLKKPVLSVEPLIAIFPSSDNWSAQTPPVCPVNT